MTRAKTDKLYRSFTKGLITEAGFLTYPDDASIDELNTVISQKGNRHRRLGLDVEGNDESTGIAGMTATDVVTEYLWRAPANKSDFNFLVVQVGARLYFFDTSLNADPANSISDGRMSFSVGLDDYHAPAYTADKVKTANVEMAAGKGYLFVVNPYMTPICIEWHPNDNTFTVTQILILQRDFDGVNDGLANDTEPNTLSNEHKYNLQNQGWVAPGTQPVVPGDPEASPGGSSEYYNPYDGTKRHWNKDIGAWEVD